jgi:hypothetical protein
MPSWVTDYSISWAALGWGALFFVATFTISILMVGFVFVRLPHDYFCNPRTSEFVCNGHPALRWIYWIGKNVLGWILVVTGIVMFVTPGQGLLTLLVGVLLVDFPGKRRLESKIIGRPRVFMTINMLRARYGKAPLIIDSETDRGNAGADHNHEPQPTHVLPRH